MDAVPGGFPVRDRRPKAGCGIAMNRFIEWLLSIFTDADDETDIPLRQSGVHAIPKTGKPKPAKPGNVEFSTGIGGKIVDGGPGKNVLIRNKYVREDTGTHETLKIVDDSLLETEEEIGADPYNTGRFDRSKSWSSSRSRK
jgi:hypothetical protein